MPRLKVFSCMTCFPHCLQTSFTLRGFCEGVWDGLAECGCGRAADTVCGGGGPRGEQRSCSLRGVWDLACDWPSVAEALSAGWGDGCGGAEPASAFQPPADCG